MGEISRSEVEEISRMDWRRGKEGHGLYPRLSPSSTDSGLVEREDFAGVRAGSVAAITEKRLKRALPVWTHQAVSHSKRAREDGRADHTREKDERANRARTTDSIVTAPIRAGR